MDPLPKNRHSAGQYDLGNNCQLSWICAVPFPIRGALKTLKQPFSPVSAAYAHLQLGACVVRCHALVSIISLLAFTY